MFLTRICARRSQIQYDNVSMVLCKFLPPVNFLVIREMSPEPTPLPKVNAEGSPTCVRFAVIYNQEMMPPIFGFKSEAQPTRLHSYCALINHHRQLLNA